MDAAADSEVAATVVVAAEVVLVAAEVVLVAEEVVLVAAADFATKDHPPKS